MIYLASRSPRRRELLTQIGVKFEPLLFREGNRTDADPDESVRPGEQADDYVRRVTRMKVEAAWQRVVMRRGLLQVDARLLVRTGGGPRTCPRELL